MAYAAVISLEHTIHRLENPINKPQITKSAYEELNSLRSILKKLDDESSRMIDRSVINELDAKIRDEVWKVEDVLESYYSLIPPSQGLDEKGVEEEIDSFLKKVEILIEEFNRVLQQNPLFEEEEEEEEEEALINNSTAVGLWFLKKVKMLREVYNRVLLQKPLPAQEEEEEEEEEETMKQSNQGETIGRRFLGNYETV